MNKLLKKIDGLLRNISRDGKIIPIHTNALYSGIKKIVKEYFENKDKGRKTK